MKKIELFGVLLILLAGCDKLSPGGKKDPAETAEALKKKIAKTKKEEKALEEDLRLLEPALGERKKFYQSLLDVNTTDVDQLEKAKRKLDEMERKVSEKKRKLRDCRKFLEEARKKRAGE